MEEDRYENEMSDSINNIIYLFTKNIENALQKEDIEKASRYIYAYNQYLVALRLSETANIEIKTE